MIYVYELTEQEKDLLIGNTYAPDSYFNPIQDFYNNWVISEEEVNFCVNPEFVWVNNLPMIIYKPKED